MQLAHGMTGQTPPGPGARHALPKGVPQQSRPERQSALVAHEAPLGLRPHELAVQTFPLEHSALVAQEAKHLDPLQV